MIGHLSSVPHYTRSNDLPLSDDDSHSAHWNELECLGQERHMVVGILLTLRAPISAKSVDFHINLN